MKNLSKINESKDVVTKDYTNSYATTTGTNSYSITLTSAPITFADLEGRAIRVKVGNASTAPITLSVNGLTAKPVMLSDGTQANTWKVDSIYTVVWNSSSSTGNFIQQGEGGVVANNSVEKTVEYDEQISMNDIIESYYRKTTSTTLVSLTQDASFTPPVATQEGVKFTPDGDYLITGYSSTPFIVYSRKNSDDTLTRLPNGIPSQPSAAPVSVDISPDGTTLVAAVTSANSLACWRRTGEFWDRVTVTQPPATTGNQAFVVRWSPNNLYFAIGTFNTPYLHMYRRPLESATGSEAPVRITTPFSDSTTLPSYVTGIAWHPNNKYVAFILDNLGVCTLYLYKWNESKTTPQWSRVTTATLTNIPFPNGTDACIAFSPDGNFLGIAGSGNSQVRIYKFNQTNETFTQISLDITGISASQGGFWTPDGSCFISPQSGVLYKKVSNVDSFTKVSIGSFLTNANSYDVSKDGRYFTFGTANQFSAKPTVFRNDGAFLFRKIDNANTAVVSSFDKVYGIAKESGTAGQTKKASILVGGNLV